MKEPRSNFASTVLGDKIFAIGGETSEGLTAKVEVYSVGLDQWGYSAELPEALADIQAVAVGGIIYVPGGRKENGDLSDQLLAYDFINGNWQDLSPLPIPLSAYALVAFEGKVYLFGGWDGSNYLNLVLRYDPTLDAWIEMAPMPTSRGFAGAAISGGRIHLIGGFNGKRSLIDHDVYFPDREGETTSPWEKATPLATPRYALGVASLADIIYVVGGLGEMSDLESVAYLPHNDHWQVFETPEGAVGAYLGVQPVGSYLYLLGGQLNSIPIRQNLAYQAIFTTLLPVFP